MGGQAQAGAAIISHAELVMGTVASFAVVPGSQADESAADAIQAACAVLHGADAIFSTWDPQSPVSRLRRGEQRSATCPR